MPCPWRRVTQPEQSMDSRALATGRRTDRGWHARAVIGGCEEAPQADHEHRVPQPTAHRSLSLLLLLARSWREHQSGSHGVVRQICSAP